MRIERIESDVLMFVGDAYESVATAFLRDSDALLVDTLASRSDAEWMRRCLVDEMGKTVRTIIATHYMSDHMAGMHLYPRAQIIAQRYHRYTFQCQRDRSAQNNEDYVNPTAVFGDTLSLQWGRHALQLFHNPGKTMCSINIDAPSCDAVFAGDNIVGNIVYLSRSSPEMIDHAIARLQLLQRGRVIGGHMGMFDKLTLNHARHYLHRLREIVVNIYQSHPHDLAVKAFQSIKIESCLAPGVFPTAFEQEWHGRNLDVVRDQGTFELDASVVSKPCTPKREPRSTAVANVGADLSVPQRFG
jgi:cyclase